MTPGEDCMTGEPPAVEERLSSPVGISHAGLFWGFTRISLVGFGGVMAWARRALVEERGWLTSQEFTSLFGLSQLIPGPTITNLSVCVGARFQGATGAIVSLLGLIAAPFLLVLAIASLYSRYAAHPAVQAMLRGIAAVAAGLILAMGVRMGRDLGRSLPSWSFTLLILAGVLLLHLPLALLMLALAPASMLVAAWQKRRTP